MINHADKRIVVMWAIPAGSQHAVTLAQLSDRTGISEREIKGLIQELRKKGYPIISMASGGYFEPDRNNPADIELAERYINMMVGQATERFATVKGVAKWLEENTSRQLELPWEV